MHLGCLAEEQKHAQPVHFSFEIIYSSNLLGSQTDQIEHAIDYVHLIEIMKFQAQKKNYKLIEHLNHEVFSELVQHLQKCKILAEIKLTVRKLRVPVENLRNGVEFSCQQILL